MRIAGVVIDTETLRPWPDHDRLRYGPARGAARVGAGQLRGRVQATRERSHRAGGVRRADHHRTAAGGCPGPQLRAAGTEPPAGLQQRDAGLAPDTYYPL